VNKVIDLNAYKEEHEPHKQGPAKCMGCKHEWQAVAPLECIEFFECPSCSAMKGFFVRPVSRFQYPILTCNCGNDLMHVTQSGTYCVNCGQWQVI
jgi:hypothetical protein